MQFNFLTLYFKICLILLFICSASFAQEFDDLFDSSDLTIETAQPFMNNKPSVYQSFTDAWTARGFGRYYISYTAGSVYRSSSQIIRMGYNQPFSFFKIFASGEAYHSFAEMDGDVKETSDDDSPTSELTVKNNRSAASIRELYIHSPIGSKADLSVGKQVLAWGQIPIFSPVDSILPIAFDKSGVAITKVDKREPMNIAKLTIYPKTNIETSFYYFEDIIIPEIFQNFSRNSPVKKETTGASAFRSVWYGKKSTLGFSYFKGMTWMQRMQGRYIENPNYNDNMSSYFRFINIQDEDRVKIFNDTATFAIEYSRLLGFNTFSFEYKIEDSTVSSIDQVSNEQKQWLIDNFDGYVDIPATTHTFGLGWHRSNNGLEMAGLVYIIQYLPKYDFEKEPTIMLGMLISKEILKASKIACALGTLPTGFGASTSFSSELFEKYTITITPQVLIPYDDIGSNVAFFEHKTAPSVSFSLTGNF